MPDDRLEIESLHVESPIALITIVAAAPSAAVTLWVLTQAFEKIANFPLNREIFKLQLDKLQKELQTTPANVPLALPETDATFREQLHLREAEYYFGRVERHRARIAVPEPSGERQCCPWGRRSSTLTTFLSRSFGACG